MLENASLQGITEVFHPQIGSAIRQVTVQGELKAAVTMVFPNWGLVDCLMSLEVGEWSVRQGRISQPCSRIGKVEAI